MPIKKSATKALRQSEKRRLRNLKVKRNLDFLIRKSRKALKAKNIDSAKDFISKTIKALDKAAQKKIIKKNTAARQKSRLVKKLNKLVKK